MKSWSRQMFPIQVCICSLSCLFLKSSMRQKDNKPIKYSSQFKAIIWIKCSSLILISYHPFLDLIWKVSKNKIYTRAQWADSLHSLIITFLKSNLMENHHLILKMLWKRISNISTNSKNISNNHLFKIITSNNNNNNIIISQLFQIRKNRNW